MSDLTDLLVGDLLWSRVPGFPYWPCMISYDPLQGNYKTVKLSKKASHVIYHVQYFGQQAERGWTTPNNIILFEGKKKFDTFIQEKKKETQQLKSSDRKKLLSQFTVTPHRLKSFETAIEEAELALEMSRTERLENFVFIYTNMPKTKSKSIPKEEKTLALEDTKTNGHITNGESVPEEIPNGKDPEKKESSTRNELLCTVCEETGANLTCSGTCFQSFHLECLGLLTSTETFLCDECSTGKHHCFDCKNTDDIIRKCSVNNCGKYYHSSCLEKHPIADKDKFICPLHACLSCYNDNPKSPCIYRVRLSRCFRCPTAYHTRDNCMAAGSLELSPFVILCPDHFVPAKDKPYQTVINISWCFMCAQGGELLCCESCPAAFHASCLNIAIPEGKYTCEECLSRTHLCYGRIVWVKIGPFQWWPARILNPDDAPLNIQNMKSYVGEFPIQYFGTKEYYWTHKGRVYPYSEEDLLLVKNDSKIDPIKKGASLQAKYKLSLEEAAEAFKEWTTAQISNNNTSSKKLPQYKHIKTNRPIGNVQILTGDVNTLSRCTCSFDDEDPCGYESQCLNRSMLVECHPAVCKTGEKCQNQMFQKFQYPKAIPFSTKNRGWALKTLEDIKKGHFVNEYVGDLIDEEECKRRLLKKHEDDDNDYYFLTLDKGRIIDAGPKGNYSRFMNHSCSPNCESQKWIVNGDLRVGLFAKHDISAGSELTFDYMLDSLDNAKLKCLCGSADCRGAIGAKPNGPSKPEPSNGKIPPKKKKKKPHSKSKADTTCFMCKKNGQLAMCDRKGCTKGYHIKCLKIKKTPSGRWQCPWHHCDTCGRLSKFLCSKCPNSYCEKHKTDDNITLHSDIYVCCDHLNGNATKMDNMELD